MGAKVWAHTILLCLSEGRSRDRKGGGDDCVGPLLHFPSLHPPPLSCTMTLYISVLVRSSKTTVDIMSSPMLFIPKVTCIHWTLKRWYFYVNYTWIEENDVAVTYSCKRHEPLASSDSTSYFQKHFIMNCSMNFNYIIPWKLPAVWYNTVACRSSKVVNWNSLLIDLTFHCQEIEGGLDTISTMAN